MLCVTHLNINSVRVVLFDWGNIKLQLNLHGVDSSNGMFVCKGKSPVVPFHGITSPYRYFEEIWIFAPIQQEAKHDQEKLSAEQK